MISDTTPDADMVRLRALQRLTPARKLHMAAGWSESVRSLSLAALRMQFPELGEMHLRRLLADKLLGPDLARRAYGEPAIHG